VPHSQGGSWWLAICKMLPISHHTMTPAKGREERVGGDCHGLEALDVQCQKIEETPADLHTYI